MATYKRITDVEVVEKNDNMNVLVEDAGALKKIPAAQVGGGSGGSIGGIFVLKGDNNGSYTANMTYEELRSAMLNDEIIWGVIKNSYETGASYDSIAYLDVYENSIEITSTADANAGYGHTPYYEFTSDGTITYNEDNHLGGGPM